MSTSSPFAAPPAAAKTKANAAPKPEAPRLDELLQQSHEAIKKLRAACDSETLAIARPLVEALRNECEYELMVELAEAISRRDPKNAKNRRLYAQALIETGKPTAAVDLLKALAKRLPKDHAEFSEAMGLLGRAHKQIFFDDVNKTSATAREALKNAIAAYRIPFEYDPAANSWHGVNLVALLKRAQSLSIKAASDMKPEAIAKSLIDTLRKTPENKRDEWYLPTLAELSLGLSDWDMVERHIHAYAADENAKAFLIGSTLRQLTEVWDVENIDDRGRALAGILRARLMQLPGGGVTLDPVKMQEAIRNPEPETDQLEAVLGDKGPETWRWWRTGLERALSVAAVFERNGNRRGTAFILRAGDIGLEPPNELLVLTAFHVVNEQGIYPGIRPRQAELAFEAVDRERYYLADEIVWSSPVERHDASLLRLTNKPKGIEPLPIADKLPPLEEKEHVYVIGHPGGGELSFSFQNNELLDHEGPPVGQPEIPGVCRIHYRAPTGHGSSGSPVLNGKLWEVIALHHKGNAHGLPRLNGKEGFYPANEGIGMISIRDAMRSAAASKA